MELMLLRLHLAKTGELLKQLRTLMPLSLANTNLSLATKFKANTFWVNLKCQYLLEQ